MKIRNLVEKDSNYKRMLTDITTLFRKGVDGSLLPKPSKSPDCELAPVQPLTRNAKMKRLF